MPSIEGGFRGSAPSLTAKIAVGTTWLGKVSFLVDTGAAHLVLTIARESASQDLVQAYATWPPETLRGIGSLTVRRAPNCVLLMTSRAGQPVEIVADPLHVLLYDVDESGFAPFDIPPSLIGFQHQAFGLSQLLVDNANQRVVLTYEVPFTPTQLG